MTPLRRLDDWIHVHIMNPVFTWIQKLFHWNRFQLIRWFMVSQPILWFLVAVAALVSKGAVVIALASLNSLIGTRRIQRLWSPLTRVSESFEETGRVNLDIDLMQWAQTN